MRGLVYSVMALLLVGSLLAHELRAESEREEREIRQQANEICPKFWANEDLAKAKDVYNQAIQVCPEI